MVADARCAWGNILLLLLPPLVPGCIKIGNAVTAAVQGLELLCVHVLCTVLLRKDIKRDGARPTGSDKDRHTQKPSPKPTHDAVSYERGWSGPGPAEWVVGEQSPIACVPRPAKRLRSAISPNQTSPRTDSAGEASEAYEECSMGWGRDCRGKGGVNIHLEPLRFCSVCRQVSK